MIGARRAAGIVRDLARGGEARRRTWLALRRPAGLFQPSGETRADRYPELFDRVARQLAGVAAPRLLSFGCATGEEVASLRARLPDAAITGLDIDPRRIAIARRRLAGDPGVRLAVAATAAGEPAGAYHAVFAMAVLRHGDLEGAPPRCDHRLRFAAFEAEVAALVRCLAPGGLLAVRHANFDVADTAAAAALRPLLAMKPSSPRYGRDDRLRPTADETVLFEKVA
jgi:trans-aconitate methyltransferase